MSKKVAIGVITAVMLLSGIFWLVWKIAFATARNAGDKDAPAITAPTDTIPAAEPPLAAIVVPRNIAIDAYFPFMDSLIARYDTLTPYPLSEYLLVRANADNGPDAERARNFGAQGIGNLIEQGRAGEFVPTALYLLRRHSDVKGNFLRGESRLRRDLMDAKPTQGKAGDETCFRVKGFQFDGFVLTFAVLEILTRRPFGRVGEVRGSGKRSDHLPMEFAEQAPLDKRTGPGAELHAAAKVKVLERFDPVGNGRVRVFVGIMTEAAPHRKGAAPMAKELQMPE